MKNRRVTLQDVAAQAGVSRQTVSRVINRKAEVSTGTRARVQSAIEELGYHCNLAARSLTQQRTHVIGLIIPYSPDYLFSDPHLLEFMTGVDELALQREYNILLSTTRLEEIQSRPAAAAVSQRLLAFERVIQTGFVDGVIVVETLDSRSGTALLRKAGMHWVTLGYGTESDSSQVVHADDRGGARQAMMHLLSLGHQRIGIISGGKRSLMSIEERLAGCRQALEDHQLHLDPELIRFGDLTSESGGMAAQSLLALPESPTAIFALNDRMAIGAMQYLQTHGWRVPEDISVVGFDDVPIARMYNPPLTTVRQPALEMGQQAVRLLFDLIENQTMLKQPVVLPTELIVRGSTGSLSTKV